MSPADRMRTLAALAAQGIAPSVSALAADAADATRWRVAVSRLRSAGLRSAGLRPAGLQRAVLWSAGLW